MSYSEQEAMVPNLIAERDQLKAQLKATTDYMRKETADFMKRLEAIRLAIKHIGDNIAEFGTITDGCLLDQLYASLNPVPYPEDL